MTTNDPRPVTAFGSIRPSDIFHDRILRKAAINRDSQVRRNYAQEVSEQIEDFEHKMGWRMRSNLGPKWSERRELEREEERTMGIKRPMEPRPKSPLQLYDYSRSNVEIVHAKQPDWAQFETEPDIFINDPSTRYDEKWGSKPPSRMGGRISTSVPGSRSNSRGLFVSSQSQRSPSAGPFRNSSRLWTQHSMIEPIFLPLSSTQRPMDHLAHLTQSPPPSAQGRTRTWEDGAGRHFWEVKKNQLMGALERTERNKLVHAQFIGENLKSQHDFQVNLVRKKNLVSHDAAHQRGEYYVRMRARADREAAANARTQWETMEAKRLGLGMDDKSRREESAEARAEMLDFENRVCRGKSAG